MNPNDSNKHSIVPGTARQQQAAHGRPGSDSHDSPTHQKPPTDNDRRGGTEQDELQREQGGPDSPDMESHQNAGRSDQEEMERRSNDAGEEDEDIDEPAEPDADVDEPEDDDDKRMKLR